MQTIDSVLIQDFTDYELIIKDGFSKDGSLNNIPCSSKILTVQERDKGIYDAMNQALLLAKGQYVLFLNAGDFFNGNSILTCYYESIITNNFPTLVYGDYKTTGLGKYVQSPPKLTRFFLFRTMLCHQVCMIKREFYERLGYFDIGIKVDADYDFLLRVLILNKARYKHIQMLGITSTSGGFSSQNTELAKKEVIKIRKKYFPNNYLVYNSILALTFPSLREKLANRTGLISKIYQRIVNIINRIF